MRTKEIAEKLHLHERKILSRVGRGKTFDLITKEAGLKRGEASRALEWLKSKGLVRIGEKAEEVFYLSKLGERYLEEGLPEVRFLRAVEKREISLGEVKKIAKLSKNELNIAVGVLKSQGKIDLVKEKVRITPIGRKFLKINPKQRLLAALKERREKEGIRKELLPLVKSLERRGIIKSRLRVERRVFLTKLGRGVSKFLKPEEKLITQLTPELLISKRWKKFKLAKYDLQAPVPRIYPGRKQVYRRFLDEVRKKLISLGFKEMVGPLVELSFFNCDALFMPQDHPAREIHAIYFVKKPKYGKLKGYEKFLQRVKKTHESGWRTGSKGWGYKFNPKEAKRLILRSHGTSLSARMLISKELEIPGKYFAIARCYRPDVVDWKHLTEFNQVEGILVDPSLTFRDLLGVLKMFALEVAKADNYKFIPSYYPFTEPSVDIYIYKRGIGWIEGGGAGIFREELTLPLGINVPVIAWGLGIDRLFMAKAGIKDIRYLFSQDLSWLRRIVI
jgi:phenylalanyl-tRNA synthetase alpha chain